MAYRRTYMVVFAFSLALSAHCRVDCYDDCDGDADGDGDVDGCDAGWPESLCCGIDCSGAGDCFTREEKAVCLCEPGFVTPDYSMLMCVPVEGL